MAALKSRGQGIIRIEAPITPVPFKRVMTSGKRRYNEARYTEFKEELGYFALKAMVGREPFKGAVRVRAQFYRLKPRRLISRLWGDVDNHLKSVLDALSGIVYADDAQVVEVSGTKFNGEPRVVIEVEEM